MYLDIFPCMETSKILLDRDISKYEFPGNFVLDSPVPGFDRGKSFSQKIAEVKIWIIINLEIILKVMDYWAYKTRYLTVRLKFSISGKCPFLDV